jgi:hypothetical protein
MVLVLVLLIAVTAFVTARVVQGNADKRLQETREWYEKRLDYLRWKLGEHADLKPWQIDEFKEWKRIEESKDGRV